MKEKKKLKPGERAFSYIMLAFSLWLLWQSAKMWQKAPGFTSYAAVPMMISVVMTVCMIIVIFVEDIRAVTEKRGDTAAERIKYAARQILPLNVALFILLIAVYLIMLLLGVNFLVSSAVFMMGTMTYLMPKDKKSFLGNLGFTAIILVVIYLVFELIFKVSLP